MDKTPVTERKLNEKQHRALDRIAKRDPEAKVIGWVQESAAFGPRILTSDGKKVVVNPSGYTRSL